MLSRGHVDVRNVRVEGGALRVAVKHGTIVLVLTTAFLVAWLLAPRRTASDFTGSLTPERLDSVVCPMRTKAARS